VAPIARWQILAALSLAALVRGFVVAFITWGVGEVAYYLVFNQYLPVAHWPILFLFLFLGGLVFANIGVSVGFWARNFDHLSAVGSFVLLPLIYLGGVFFSIEHLPQFWQGIARLNPLLYMINGVRFGLLGVSDVDWLTAFAVSFGAFIFTSLLAILSLRRGSFHHW
jgi:ABC-2 type transport system permease protein